MSLSSQVSTKDTNVKAFGASCASPVGETKTENGFLNSKANLDSKMHRALTECIRHHQQILL
jgi:hypothetical protein